MTAEHGFSLIEVLVALALTGVLLAVVSLPLTIEDSREGYEQTIAIMNRIREAMLGRPNLYCNGQRQFTGFVADMGGLPALVDENGDPVEDWVEDPDGAATLRFPQPRALWTRDINANGDTDDEVDIPDGFCWRYYETQRIWAGWRGPYLDPPADGILRDGWGNPLLFSEGEIITLKEETVVEYDYQSSLGATGSAIWSWTASRSAAPGTYRCRIAWAFPGGPGGGTQDGSGLREPLPGFDDPYRGSWGQCWEALPDALAPVIEPRENFETPEEYRSVVTNLFYGAGTWCVVSYGADGEPGGSGYDQDLTMTIYPNEYTGEVAGMVGNGQENFADAVAIGYPDYLSGHGDLVQWSNEILVANIPSRPYGKNFYFGTAPLADGQAEDGSRVEIPVPMGVRSIRARGSQAGTAGIHVFTVEPTGNFVGTLRAQ